MKRITATFLFLTALSAPAMLCAPAMAETPVERQMHSWDYVQQVANPTMPQSEAPMEHHEQRPYYHHDAEMHKGKHSGKMHHHHHDGKMHHHHHAGKPHHHHHHKDAKKDSTAPAKDQSKQ